MMTPAERNTIREFYDSNPSITIREMSYTFGLTEKEIKTILQSEWEALFDDTYDEFGVNTKNSFNTPPAF